ncbi:unnamed protein product [Pleuronectes platessa]|uniref:Uncharacterized protein n=1 Tax=Pleuronectes platessa TaxID=8262 RepID=A0A9N7V600_PLEPL|nr:unnamed protein product [Pleuronectes platessa]
MSPFIRRRTPSAGFQHFNKAYNEEVGSCPGCEELRTTLKPNTELRAFTSTTSHFAPAIRAKDEKQLFWFKIVRLILLYVGEQQEWMNAPKKGKDRRGQAPKVNDRFYQLRPNLLPPKGNRYSSEEGSLTTVERPFEGKDCGAGEKLHRGCGGKQQTWTPVGGADHLWLGRPGKRSSKTRNLFDLKSISVQVVSGERIYRLSGIHLNCLARQNVRHIRSSPGK